MKKESISIFDIIKTGIGPSSSHTVGPWRAALLFLEHLINNDLIGEVNKVDIYLYGSLAKTGSGHGTDLAVMLGLAGYDFKTIDTDLITEITDDIRNNKIINLAGQRNIPFDPEYNIIFEFNTSLDEHPNGMKINAVLNDESIFTKTYFSVGGGFVVEEGTPLKPESSIVTKYPCHNAKDIFTNTEKLGLRISDLVMLNESVWRNEDEIRSKTLKLWDEMKQCIFRGIRKKGDLPGGLNVKRRANDLNNNLLNDKEFNTIDEWLELIRKGEQDFNTISKWIAIFALAVNEENASFGRVVTAPTNGASGVIPAVLMFAYCFYPEFNEEEIIRFILTAGEIGTLYKKGATISGAMGGCQAEISVSSSMAAAGLTEALGGTQKQVLQAAEIAMEHHLGLTCDPIKGLVQIPCIERNIMGAIKAITATNIALASNSFLARISLDDVIQTMLEIANDMNSKYKETSEGGLAKIPINIVEC